MKYLVTICSKDKRLDPVCLPSIERYLSPRIAFVHGESLRLGLPLLILSGKFGLLRPQDPIPWYDHKLTLQDIPDLLPQMTARLEAEGVTSVLFHCRPKTDKDWYPYHSALEQACQKLGIKIDYQLTDFE